jgi:predicted ester cyclase
MTCANNKAVVVRFIRDGLNMGDIAAFGELIAADHVLHSLQGDMYGPEGVRIAVMEYRTDIPDLVIDVEEIMADGD